MAARIDQLPTAGRQLIRDASILGSTFDRELAARVLERPELVDAAVWTDQLGDLVTIDDEQRAIPPRSRSRRRIRGPVDQASRGGPSSRRRRDRRLGRRCSGVGSGRGVGIPRHRLRRRLQGRRCGTRRRPMRRWRRARWRSPSACSPVSSHAQRETRAGPRCAPRDLLSAGSGRRARRPPRGRARRLPARARVSPARPTGLGSRSIGRGSSTVLGRYRAGLVTTARALRTCHDRVRAWPPRARAGEDSELPRAMARVPGARRRTARRRSGRRRQAASGAGACARRSGVAARWGSRNVPRTRWRRNGCSSSSTTRSASPTSTSTVAMSAWQRVPRAPRPSPTSRASSERYKRAGDVLGAALADNNLAEVLTLQLRLDEAERLLVHARRVHRGGELSASARWSRSAACPGSRRGAATPSGRCACSPRRSPASASSEQATSSPIRCVRLVEIHVIAGDADGCARRRRTRPTSALARTR